MNTTCLKREPVTEEKQYSKESVDLGKEVYQKTAHGIAWENARRTEDVDKLHAAMRQLDIRPFTEKSIAKYKRKMENKAANFIGGSTAIVMIACVIIGVTAACWHLIFSVTGASADMVYTMFATSHVMCVAACVLGVILTVGTVKGWFESGKWSTYSPYSFTQPIPEYVQQTIVDLANACPAASFYIEALDRLPDPILYVNIPSYNTGRQMVNYAIEVWDEPKYKQEREV